MNIWPLPRITFRELSTVREARPTALITDPAAWATIKRVIELPLAIQCEPPNNERAYLESLGADLPSDIGVVYAVGNGHVIDAAKIVASAGKKPLVIIPTAFCDDCPLTSTASVREKDISKDVETGPAEEVIVDWDTVTDAPSYIRGAGIVDILSIVPALLDWRYASQKNMTTPETRLSAWGMGVAAALASQAIKNASAVGQGSAEALRGLLDLLCMAVQLDNQLGHRRASHGTEHIFADHVKADASVSHAERVAAGILYAAALHGQDVTPLRDALEKAGGRLNVLKAEDIRSAAKTLPDYARSHNLPYTILNDQTSTDAVNNALNKSTLIAAPQAT